MRRILHYECFSGISGDMNLAAMLDLGLPLSYLTSELSKLGMDSEFELEVNSQAEQAGIFGTQVKVKLLKPDNSPRRHLQDIVGIIRGGTLPRDTQELAIRIFTLLAEAEAVIHRTTADKVHFHEVGAIDSLVDIVGAAIAYHFFSPDEVIVSPLELGGGWVECEHGKMPVPAPATAKLVEGIPTQYGGADFETTTPTGAAIVKAIATSFLPPQNIVKEQTAFAIGRETSLRANVLRVSFGQRVNPFPRDREEVWQLSCNVDDMSPEWYGLLMDGLFEQGALDVWWTPISMKKNRPATLISLLCIKDQLEVLENYLLKHTTTLGVRSAKLQRVGLPREDYLLDTPYGEIPMKRVFFEGKVIREKPEISFIERISKERGVPIWKVAQLISEAIKTNEKSKIRTTERILRQILRRSSCLFGRSG